MTPLLPALMLAASLSAAAQAPKIYRCGADGRQLQQAPCGDVKPAVTAPAPSAGARAEAAAIARREAALAEQMAREREQRQRIEARQAAPAFGIGPPPAPPASAPKASTRKKRSSKKTAGGAFSPAS